MKFLLYILLFISFLSSAQKSDIRISNFNIDFFTGQHIKHDKKLASAINGLSYGFLLSFNQASNNNSIFNKLYNYPEKGFSILYHNLNANALGEMYAGFRQYTFYLNPTKKNNLYLTTGLGIGYVTKTYHKTKNAINYAFASHILAAAYIKFQFLNILKSNNWAVNTGFGLQHFSNTSFKNPNLGLNTIYVNLGLQKRLKSVKITRASISKIKNQPIKYNLIFRGGFNESKIIDSGLYPFYTVSFFGSKQINNYSKLTAGIDFFSSEFLKHYIEYMNEENNENVNTENYFRGGLFVGHALQMNRFMFISQVGFYALYPYTYESRVYERFGLQYKLGKSFFTELSLKVNLFRAEALALGLGYQF